MFKIMQRRSFLHTSGLFLGGGLLAGTTDAMDMREKPTATIGLLTDVHYADKPPKGTRFYRDSLEKAKQAAAFFTQAKPDLLICLGDLIDAAPTLEEETSNLRTISRLLDQSGIPRRHVLGNHCVHSLTKAEFFKSSKLEQKAGHFTEVIGGTRLIILDACFNGDMQPYQRKNFEWTDTNVPPAQIQWLENELTESSEPAVVFVHQRLDLDPADKHTVNQSPEIRAVLEASGKVSAVFQGHSHKNELKSIQGIDYCTLAALIEGSGVENNAYGLLEIYPDGSMKLNGYHQQADRRFDG